MDKNVVIKLEGVTKKFKGVPALEKIHLEAKKGEIMALLGENGAGKSTVLNIMSGALPKDEGEIYYNGKPTEFHSPLAAKRAGVVKVHQELQVVPEMTAFENIFLGNEIKKPGVKLLWYKKMKAEADKLLAELEADFESDRVINSLSTAQQQLVEIAKALNDNFSVLILDEPTSSLTTREIDKLFAIMKRLKEQGKTIIFVSHRLEEVFEISDRITVFRDGHYVTTLDTKDTSREELIKHMTGRDLSKVIKNNGTCGEEIVLSVRGLCGENERFHDISFDLHKGEILGFAGLVGAGRTEIMRALFGADKCKSGEVILNGKKLERRSPKISLRNGLALIPEDRKRQGFVGVLANMYNAGLASYDMLAKKRILSDRVIRKNATQYMDALKVKPMDVDLNTENLSGGNQQKIVIAKWLSVKPGIIIMDEPTRGIDVGAKDEIYKLMLDLVGQGVSIIMISSELPEILNMSNRIIVMHEGKITGEFLPHEASETKILHYAMGGM